MLLVVDVVCVADEVIVTCHVICVAGDVLSRAACVACCGHWKVCVAYIGCPVLLALYFLCCWHYISWLVVIIL